MRIQRVLAIILLSLVIFSSSAGAGEDATRKFVLGLYDRFAFRAPSAHELEYWSGKVYAMTPEAAETHLKNFFFIHAAYKTIVDRTVTIDEVESMVDMLDSGKLTFQSVQWSLFHSDEYKLAKAHGRVGQMMNERSSNPS